MVTDFESLKRDSGARGRVVEGQVDGEHEGRVGEDVQGEAAQGGALGADVEDVVCDGLVDAAGALAVEGCETAGPGVRKVDAQMLHELEVEGQRTGEVERQMSGEGGIMRWDGVVEAVVLVEIWEGIVVYGAAGREESGVWEDLGVLVSLRICGRVHVMLFLSF